MCVSVFSLQLTTAIADLAAYTLEHDNEVETMKKAARKKKALEGKVKLTGGKIGKLNHRYRALICKITKKNNQKD